MIQIRNLAKTYLTRSGDAVEALQDINLDIGEKEFVTVVGTSGCGKSTLLKLIAGLILPTTGAIRIEGNPVIRPYPDVGMVFQNATLLPWRDILGNVLLPIEVMRHRVADYLPVANELLDLVGLAGFARRYPRELSGGMQQRAAICRALIHDPRLLLMDEPFGALDAMTREELSMELLRIWEERQKTVVFVTHSIPEAILLADKVVVLTPRPGQIAQVIRINLPRPRQLEMAFTDSFRIYSEEIRGLISQRLPKLS